MQRKILITGATGLVGSHVLIRFCMEEIPVRALVRNREAAIDKLRKLSGLYALNAEKLLEHVEFTQGDLCDLEEIQNAMQGIDSVIHCAGLVSFRKKDCEQVYRLNAGITGDLVNAALEHQVSWFCHISSVAAFGKSEQHEIDENIYWKNHPAASCYAISKYNAEREVWRAGEEGLPVLVFAPSVITGPDEKETNLGNVFSILKNWNRWYIPGKTGYVDARDVADAVWIGFQKKLSGEKYILNAENLDHQVFLQYCAVASGLKAPQKALSPLLIKLTGLAGSMLSLMGISSRIPDSAMIHTLHGNREYRNEKFIKISGIKYRNIRDSIQLMAYAMNVYQPSNGKLYKPGW